MASSPVRRARRSTGRRAGQSPNGLPTKHPGRVSVAVPLHAKKREVVNRKATRAAAQNNVLLCGDPFTTRSTSNRCRQCVSDGIAREKEANKSLVHPRVKALLDKQPPDVRQRAIQIAAQHLKAMRAVHVPEAINLTAIPQEAIEVARLGEEGTAQPVQYEYRNFAIQGGEK